MGDLRRSLHSAYSFVRGVEQNRATASLTLNHLLQAQIQRIKGGENAGRRPSKLQELEKLEQDMEKVVKAVQDAGDDPDKLEALGVVEEGT